MVLTERCWAKKTLGFWTLSFDSLGSLFVGVVKTPNITTSQIRDVLSTAMDISWDMPTFRSQSQTLQWKTAWSPLLLSLRQKSSGICLRVKKSRSLMRKVYKYNWCKVCKYNWKKTIEKRYQPDSLLEIFEVLWLWIVPVVWIIRGVAHLQAQMKWNWEMNKKTSSLVACLGVSHLHDPLHLNIDAFGWIHNTFWTMRHHFGLNVRTWSAI